MEETAGDIPDWRQGRSGQGSRTQAFILKLIHSRLRSSRVKCCQSRILATPWLIFLLQKRQRAHIVAVIFYILSVSYIFLRAVGVNAFITITSVQSITPFCPFHQPVVGLLALAPFYEAVSYGKQNRTVFYFFLFTLFLLRFGSEKLCFCFWQVGVRGILFIWKLYFV